MKHASLPQSEPWVAQAQPCVLGLRGQVTAQGHTTVARHERPRKGTGQAQATLSQGLTQTSAILGRFPRPAWFTSLVALNSACFKATSPASPCTHTNFPQHPLTELHRWLLDEPLPAPFSSLFP